MAVQRHKEAGHIVNAAVMAKDAAEVASGDKLLCELEALKGRAEKILNATEKEESYSIALGAIKELRELARLYGELAGKLRQNTTNVLITGAFDESVYLSIARAILDVLDD
ncbi:MAG TPA: hypothetical protein VMW87_15740, partial [Spirochaetia bacterium]|nr:hypothetical protein [Spirochaetia bacterium]